MRDRKSFESKIKLRDSKTQKAYVTTLNSFESWLGDKTVTQDNVEDVVQDYINWFSMDAPNGRRGKGHSPNTVWNYYSRIKKYLKHLGILIDEIELPSKPEKDLYPLKLSDMHAIFEVMSYHDVTMHGLQASSGLRIGETVGLRKRDFVWHGDRYIIKIPATIAKFKKARTVVCSKEMSKRIANRLKKISDEDLVFGTSESIETSEGNKANLLRDKLEKIGLNNRYDDTGNYEINTHSFRAYFITRVSRHDPNIAKKMAGEKGYLLQYDRLTDEELIEEYVKFEADLTIFDLAKKDAKQDQENRVRDEKIALLEDTVNKLAEQNKLAIEKMIEMGFKIQKTSL